MLVGYMGVSTDGDRQVLDLQRDALLGAGVDERHLFEDHASGSRDARAGLAKALAFVRSGDLLPAVSEAMDYERTLVRPRVPIRP